MYIQTQEQFDSVITKLESNDPSLKTIVLDNFDGLHLENIQRILGALPNSTFLENLSITIRYIDDVPDQYSYLSIIFTAFMNHISLNTLVMSPWELNHPSQKYQTRLEKEFLETTEGREDKVWHKSFTLDDMSPYSETLHFHNQDYEIEPGAICSKRGRNDSDENIAAPAKRLKPA